ALVTPPSANISWTGPNGFGATTANISIPGADYTDTGRYIISADNGGCIARDTLYAIVGNVDFDLGNDTTICNGDALVLSPSIAGAQYTWQDGHTGPSYTVSVAGSYHVHVVLGSCFKRDTINIGVQNIEIELPPDTVLCRDALFKISVADTFDSYIWSTGSTQSTATIDDGGLYWLKVSKGPCFVADTMQVQLLEPYFHLGNDTTLCNGRTITLRPGSVQGSSYYWQDGSTKDFFIVKEKGLYHVTATNICGTFGSNIQVDYIQCECYPIMPNAFTPNKDGLNDAIGPILTCIPADFKYIVANRWGEIVFETEDYTKKWDGRHISIPSELGTYFYLIQITDRLGNKTTHKGDILLLR
ncbi:MAG: gliding motility-associated C-terminal domain-containing protein, partial [Taibaiella sp.]|nr:gliding motility-associated C-terminal domain-containing protein [Taibaiella sp.]